MRQEILDYLLSQNLGVFTVSSDVPWIDNGTPLYLKNLKKIYVDQDQEEIVPIFQTLDGNNIQSRVTTVRVYLASDAKQLPPSLSTAISGIRAAKDVTTITGVNRRECDVITSMENDVLVNELEFRFTTILT